jgi:uncharacterized protein YodC (DUF2158 family)
MEEGFKRGEIVQLKSGGPDLTIEEIYENRFVWFNGGLRKEGDFYPETLKKR